MIWTNFREILIAETYQSHKGDFLIKNYDVNKLILWTFYSVNTFIASHKAEVRSNLIGFLTHKKDGWMFIYEPLATYTFRKMECCVNLIFL